MKVLGEREIFASLVKVELYLIAEIIRKESEQKKTKVKAPVMTKKGKKYQTSNTHYSASWAEAAMKLGVHVDLV